MVVRRSGGRSIRAQPRRSAASSHSRHTGTSVPEPSARQCPNLSPRSMVRTQIAHVTMRTGYDADLTDPSYRSYE